MTRSHFAVLALGALIIAGCVTASGPQIVAGNEESVIVQWYFGGVSSYFAETFAVAEAHCAQYGKKAKYVGKARDFDAVYDCVK